MCDHITALDFSELARRFGDAKFQKKVKDSHTGCDECDVTLPHLWACLARGCSHIGCGRQHSMHAKRHYEQGGHPLCICLGTAVVWCYSCDKEVIPQSNDDASDSFGDGGDITNRERELLGIQAMVAMNPDFSEPMEIEENDTEVEETNGLIGLVNLGNTCYMSAVLQSLSKTPPLMQYFLHCHPALSKYARNDGMEVIVKFSDLMKTIWDADSDRAANPEHVRRAVGRANQMFMGWGQQDSHEFLLCLLDLLHEGLLKTDGGISFATKISNDDEQDEKTHIHHPHSVSAITKIFGGEMQSRVRCLKCNKTSTTNDPFLDLSLPIPQKRCHVSDLAGSAGGNAYVSVESDEDTHAGFLSSVGNWLGIGGSKGVSLYDCLYSFCAPERLDGDEKYYCEHCKTHVESDRHILLSKLPEVLIIELKRFRGGHDFYFSSKISVPVRFELEHLDLTQFTLLGSESDGATYNLFSVVNHRGGIGGGHYVCYAQQPVSQDWYLFNDVQCGQVSSQTVAECEAYLLFYRRNPSVNVTQKHHDVMNVWSEESVRGMECLLPASFYSLFRDHVIYPGPIHSSVLKCEHGVPTFKYMSDDQTVAVSRTLYDTLVREYGGNGPPVFSKDVSECEVCCTEAQARQQRRIQEKNDVTGLDTRGNSGVWYIIEADWLVKWHAFTNCVEWEDGVCLAGKPALPPGPISNNLLMQGDKPRPHRRKITHYRGVNEAVWNYFYDRYGGEPVLRRSRLDLYADEV